MYFKFVVLVMLFCAIQIYPQHSDFQTYVENKLNKRTIVSEKQINGEYLVTEAISQEWNNSEWINTGRYSFFYNQNNVNDQYTYEVWNNNQWNNDSRGWLTYDSNNNVIEELTKAWIDTGWVNSEKYLYEYDQNQNTTLEKTQSWNSTEWINSSQYVYTYTNNNLTETLYQEWNNTEWESVDRTQYTYTNNNLTEELYQEYIIEWKNISLTLNSYDSQNNVIETLNKNWDGNDWFLEVRKTHQYSNGNLTVITLQEGWIDTLWSNIGLFTQTYNNSNSLVEYTSQFWNGINAWVNQQRWILTYLIDNRLSEWVTQFWQSSQWVNFSRLKSTFDGNGNETVFAWEKWQNSAWQNYLHTVYNYTLVASIKEDFLNELNFSLSQNYPNPFNPTTTISWRSPVGSYQTIKLYDALGNEIETVVNDYFDAGNHSKLYKSGSTLTSGVYFYQLRAGNYVETKKMILLK